MRGPLAPMTATVALVAAGCGAAEEPALPPACQEGRAAVVTALGAAPDPVRLEDGTPLSACVAAAPGPELQSVGLVLHGAAEDLADRGDAVALGYLVGAARRGADATAGIALELVRRLESTARQLPASARERLAAGLRAGEATG